MKSYIEAPITQDYSVYHSLVLRKTEPFDFVKTNVGIKKVLKKLLAITDRAKLFIEKFNPKEKIPQHDRSY